MTFEEIIYTERGRLPYKSNRDKYKYYKDTLKIAYSCEDEVLRESAKYMCKYIEEHYPHILQKYLEWIKPTVVALLEEAFAKSPTKDIICNNKCTKIRKQLFDLGIIPPIIYNCKNKFSTKGFECFGYKVLPYNTNKEFKYVRSYKLTKQTINN
jgi:hypothetical protein